MADEQQVLVVLCTFPDAEKARQIGTLVVERQLAACVNLVPGIESIYQWEGKVCRDTEVLGVIKTREGRLEALREALVEEHSYDVPEVIALPVTAGSAPYLEWVRQHCGA